MGESMKVIISPAKKMQIKDDFIEISAMPAFVTEADRLRQTLREYSMEKLKELFGANDEITALNHRRFQEMDLYGRLTPAVLSYVGLQYQSMAPEVFTSSQWDYVDRHLQILSGFYGVLQARDGVTPYRLEMQARLPVDGKRNLYQFWGSRIYEHLVRDSRVIINLASKEYSKVVEPYLEPEVRLITCIFGYEAGGKVKVKATEAKMARGAMVRWMAEHQAEEPEQIKEFAEMNYRFRQDLSTEDKWVYTRSLTIAPKS